MNAMDGARHHVEMIGTAASPEEAAAAIAGVQRFLADHAPMPAPAVVEAPESGWLRAARLEGVDRDPGVLPWH